MRPIDADRLKFVLEKNFGHAGGASVLEQLIDEQPTIQPEKAQLSQQGTTSDLISKTETAEHLRRVLDATVPVSDYDEGYVDGVEFGISTVSTMPTVQPVATDTNVGDTISRQQAIDALDTAIEHYDGIAEECRKKADIERNDYMDMRDDAYEARQLAQWLNELKYLREKIEQLTIKPEPQWVPCSEKLPEEAGYYITSSEYGGVTVDFYYDNFWNSRKNAYKVLAWMPLPKIYRPNK